MKTATLREPIAGTGAQTNLFAPLFVDCFAGGGGWSTGAELALGRIIDIAINHDPDAILMHETNHPYTRHYCEDIYEVDPVSACGGRHVAWAHFSPDYNVERQGHYIGGIGDIPAIALQDVEKDGDLLRLHILLVYGDKEWAPNENKMLTARLMNQIAGYGDYLQSELSAY